MRRSLLKRYTSDRQSVEVAISTEEFSLTPEEARVIGQMFEIDAELITSVHIDGPSVKVTRAFWNDGPSQVFEIKESKNV